MGWQESVGSATLSIGYDTTQPRAQGEKCHKCDLSRYKRDFGRVRDVRISEGDWESLAKNMLRAELMRRGLSYARLVEALAHLGVQETEASIKNKVSRGRFTLVFFLQCMVAIGAEWVQVPSSSALDKGEGVGEGGAQKLARGQPMPTSAVEEENR